MEIEQYCEGLERHLRDLKAESDELRRRHDNAVSLMGKLQEVARIVYESAEEYEGDDGETVFQISHADHGLLESVCLTCEGDDVKPLSHHLKPLTDKQIRAIEVEVSMCRLHTFPTDAIAFARAIEKAHRIGNE